MAQKIVTGHQPSYLPWLGLIHKASLGDVFVFMDDVQFTKDDFMHRNRIKTVQGQSLLLNVPVDLKNSKSDRICDILIDNESQQQKNWQEKHWTSIRLNYSKAPFFNEYKGFFESIYMNAKWEKLAELDLAILKKIFEWFEIEAELVVGSTQNFSQKKSDLLLEHVERFNGNVLVTGTQGKNYINAEQFAAKGISVYHQEYRHPVYAQRGEPFVPNLCFLDLLFNHGPQSREIALSGNVTKNEL